ncbi:MAG: rod shape-determining protein [Phototrophicales bacterium]|nr:MAG: rod shape-determining protein [Phototrophicales bacterium]RMG76145.1 MAG: rod shape-determining protein [Chloroflexota bacterium]
MPLFSKSLGIDLGTVNVLIYENGQIVLQEPSLVAVSAEEDLKGNISVLEIGQPAREMMGRVFEEEIQVVRPLQNGVIADYEVAQFMLAYFMGKVAGRMRLFKPTVMISVPYGVTSVEKRAVREAAIEAGSREAFLIWEPLAAAIGAGLPVSTPAGDMVVNIGGGITEAAVISMSNIVRAESGRVGGLKMDDAIISYVRRKYNLVIGQPTAEAVKIQIGAAVNQPEDLSMEIQGRDNVSGLPRTITLTTGEVVEALAEPLNTVAGVVKSVLSNTPPELASDIIDRGITLTGGGALLRGIDDFLTRETEVPVYRAENPMIAVAVGAGRALEDRAILRRLTQQAY